MKTQSFSAHFTVTVIRMTDVMVAALTLLACLPLICWSCMRSLLQGQPVIVSYSRIDCLNRPLTLSKLNSPPMPSLGLLLDVLRGEISLCGLEILSASAAPEKNPPATTLRAGVFSSTALHQLAGLAEYDRSRLIRHHIEHYSFKHYLLTVFKSSLMTILFSKNNLATPNTFCLFGLRINNTTMLEAISWATAKGSASTARLGFFVNVNSINLAVDKPLLRDIINAADRVFADGSGVRLGAKHHGIALRDNVNGTDLLPKLCKAAEARSLSLYLLGAAPGIARRAADKLQEQYPELRIVGTHHGYFDKRGVDTNTVINAINQSGADILLTGFGSPIQETWLLENRDNLQVTTAMAVGGLFDFFSEAIERAPQWMRELGLEWVWRLLQDPATKWRRYVLGNPLFLYRLWFSYED